MQSYLDAQKTRVRASLRELSLSRRTVRGNLMAGPTFAAVNIAQGPAYALAAGITPVNGLYTLLTATPVAALFTGLDKTGIAGLIGKESVFPADERPGHALSPAYAEAACRLAARGVQVQRPTVLQSNSKPIVK